MCVSCIIRLRVFRNSQFGPPRPLLLLLLLLPPPPLLHVPSLTLGLRKPHTCPCQDAAYDLPDAVATEMLAAATLKIDQLALHRSVLHAVSHLRSRFEDTSRTHLYPLPTFTCLFVHWVLLQRYFQTAIVERLYRLLDTARAPTKVAFATVVTGLAKVCRAA